MLLSDYHRSMGRILKIFIGIFHEPEEDITSFLSDFWANVYKYMPYIIHVREDHAYVAFVTDDTSFQFLDSVTESMAGIDNVKSEELNPEEVLIAIGEVKGLEYLRYSSQHHDKDLVEDHENKNPVDKHDPAVNSDPEEQIFI